MAEHHMLYRLAAGVTRPYLGHQVHTDTRWRRSLTTHAAGCLSVKTDFVTFVHLKDFFLSVKYSINIGCVLYLAVN